MEARKIQIKKAEQDATKDKILTTNGGRYRGIRAAENILFCLMN